MAVPSHGRVLVTGGAGFIGSHVVDAFVERGYDALVVDDLSTGRRDNVRAGVDLAQVDIRDDDALRAVFGDFRPTAVCHLAAQASVTVSVDEPRTDLEINVLGTLNVVSAAQEARAPVVFASTGGALYGDDAPLPTPETADTRPLSPYGASKLAGEAYVGTWSRLYGTPNAVLRLGNVFGPRQQPHGEAGVVAIFSDILARGAQPAVRGDGQQTRDYIHVHDVAQAFLLAAESGATGTFNVGLGKETTVLELLEHLQAAAGTAVEPVFEPLRAGELMRSALDSTAIARDLGWSSEVPLAEGLASTYRSFAPA